MKVHVHPEARDEMREAARYYCQFSDQLPPRLRREMEQAIEKISADPRHHPLLEGEWRKIRLKRFPYGLIYRESDNEIQVIAFAHHKRCPGYWKEREIQAG